MKFKYTALGANNQKLEGVLEAESLETAQENLHKMGLSIIACNEVSDEEFAQLSQKQPAPAEGEAAPEITTYYFTAQDAQNKEVNGTIDARDPYSAYKRLIAEYQFKVLDLYEQNAPDPEAASQKGNFEEWNNMLKSEGIDLEARKRSAVKGELEEGEKLSEEIIQEMDQFIINTKKILETHKNQYSEAFYAEIEKKLDELERIRASNNLKHITKVCNDLFELISHPDNVEGAAAPSDEEYQQMVAKLEGSGFVQNRFKFMEAHSLQKKLARFEKVQRLLTKIQKVLRRGKSEQIEKNFTEKMRKRREKWLAKLTGGLGAAKPGEKPHITYRDLVKKFFDYLFAPNTILKRARKQELVVSYHEWKAHRAKVKASRKAGKPVEGEEGVREFADFYMELDSFVGWLLFFYLAYFFVAGYTIERNIGLPKDMILKTFASPLLINIAIFLIFAHLAFTLKLKFFRANFLGSLFLFFLSFGIYTILIVNF